MRKKILFSVVSILLILSMISFISAEQKYCCEKTKVKDDGKGGAWCMIAEESQCAEGFQKAPTSCESTSYCRMGCCFNSKDGSCSLNTAKKTCEENNGIWDPDASCNIVQCQRGCCIQGSNAFIDTATGCKYSASALNIPFNFNQQITNEIECRMQITSENKGACVYQDPQSGQKTCKFVTQKECLELRKQKTGETTEQASQSFFQRVFGGGNKSQTVTETTIEVEFFEDRLCTDETLKTNCIKSKKTTCSNDRVYFVDSCGNLASIYDSAKYDDTSYWTRVYDLDESCGYGQGNKNSATCGNCEPLDGSMCGIKRTGDAAPKIGDYLCRSLDCTYQGKTYSHGESWCATKDFGNKGIEDNLPGSEHFVLKCNNGDVTSESCDSFRKMICSEQEVLNGFSVAKCVTNRWTNCYEQNSSKDCENIDKRDCKWIEKGISKLKVPGQNIQIDAEWNFPNEQCIPEFAPGFNFWEDGTDAEAICARASIKCKVTYKKGLLSSGSIFDDDNCDKNCFCLNQEWKDYVSGICSSLGDCGVSVNYINQEGYNEQEDLFQKY